MTSLNTARLTLRPFTADDLPDFVALHADPHSMVDYGRPDTAAQAEAKLALYLKCQARHGLSRMHVSDDQGFIGYVGVFRHDTHTPIGPHSEIGWRLLPRAWGQGLATEAARAALTHAFAQTGLTQVLAYTAPDNLRSQSVMTRLGLHRDSSRDFTEMVPDLGAWSGRVWVANRQDWLG